MTVSLTVTAKPGTRVCQVNEKKERIYRRTYIVVATEKTSIHAVRLALGIPRVGAAFTDNGVTDAAAPCVSVEPHHIGDTHDGGEIYEVSCEWKFSPDPRKNKYIENPLDRPPVIAWTTQIRQLTRFADLDGKPWVNSVGDPFENPPQLDDVLLVLDYTRNEATYDAALARSFVDSVNSDAFYGAPKYTVKCDKFDGTAKKEVITQDDVEITFLFWEVHYQFSYSKIPWHPVKVLDQGPRHYDSGDPDASLVVNLDDNGLATTIPCLLREDGTNITHDDLKGGEQPHFCEFRCYESRAFSALNL